MKAVGQIIVVMITTFALSVAAKNIQPTETQMKEQAYWDQMELVARIVQAEAGNQGLKGKRLVACVILNRIE